MYETQVVEEKSVMVTFRTTGLPTVSHPQLGDNMSNGITINESNQKEYSMLYDREFDDCEIFGLENAEFISIITNSNHQTELTLLKRFGKISDDEVEYHLKSISNLSVFDKMNDEMYSVKLEMDSYEINDY